MARKHWHVHSKLPGYLCECDEHYPLTAAERDASLREEKRGWQDYAADTDATYSHIVITGSIRAGRFDIDDTKSMGWSRMVESWECSEPECWTLLDR